MSQGLQGLLDDIRSKKLKATELPARIAALEAGTKRLTPSAYYEVACVFAHAQRYDEALSLLGSECGPMWWLADDPYLEDLRKAQPTRWRRATGAAGSKLPLSRLDTIGPKGAASLRRAEIMTARQVVGRAGKRDARARLSDRIGIDSSRLIGWAQVAEMVTLFESANGQKPWALDVANLAYLVGIVSVDDVKKHAEPTAAAGTSGAARVAAPAQLQKLVQTLKTANDRLGVLDWNGQVGTDIRMWARAAGPSTVEADPGRDAGKRECCCQVIIDDGTGAVAQRARLARRIGASHGAKA